MVALALWGCGSSSDVNVNSPTGCDGGRGPQITGTVQMPHGRVARAGGMLERVAGTVWSAAEAISGAVSPVGANVSVQLVELRPEDVAAGRNPGPVEVGLTRKGGEFCIGLPEGTDESVCRYMVQVGSPDQSTLTRAFVFSTGERIDIDFRSEAAVRMILASIPPAGLCDFSPGGIRGIYDAVAGAPGVATGEDADEINAVAETIASADPGVEAAVAAALVPTPPPPPTRAGTRTPTPIGPTATRTRAVATATPPRSPSAPPTRTATATVAIVAPTRTPTETPASS